MFVRWPMALIKRLPVFRLFVYYKYLGLLKRSRLRFRATTNFGATLECGPRDLIERTILMFGVWEPNISYAMQNLVAPGDFVADIGSNIGYDTLLTSKLVGPGGRIISIEASPSTFSDLEKNVTENRCENVRAVNAAVSDAAGRLNLYSASSDNTGASTTVEKRGIESSVVTIDSAPLDLILSKDEMAKLSLIKIDIEGAELPVLRNILSNMDSYSPQLKILVEASCETEDRADWAKLFDRFRSLGFSAFSIENEYSEYWYLSWRRPSLPVPLAELPMRQTDILFTRQPLPQALAT